MTGAAFTTCTEEMFENNNNTYEISNGDLSGGDILAASLTNKGTTRKSVCIQNEIQPDSFNESTNAMDHNLLPGKGRKSVCIQNETGTSSFSENVSMNPLEINVIADESMQTNSFNFGEQQVYCDEISDPVMSDKVFDFLVNDPQTLSEQLPGIIVSDHSTNSASSQMELKLEDSTRNSALGDKSNLSKSEQEPAVQTEESNITNPEQKSMEVSTGNINKTFEISATKEESAQGDAGTTDGAPKDDLAPLAEEIEEDIPHAVAVEHAGALRQRKPENKSAAVDELSKSFSAGLQNIHTSSSGLILLSVIFVIFSLMFLDLASFLIAAK